MRSCRIMPAIFGSIALLLLASLARPSISESTGDPKKDAIAPVAEEEAAMTPEEFNKQLSELASKHEETTELVEGVTVADLLRLNETSPSDCSREDLFKRHFVCSLTKEIKHIRRYCLECLDRSARFCANELLGRNLNVNYIARAFAERKRSKAMSKEDSVLWQGVLKIPDGDREAMEKHLNNHLIIDGDYTKPVRLVWNVFEDERINGTQLIKRLFKGKILEYREVAISLAMTKDKANTMLPFKEDKQMSVADMLYLNDISTKYCLPDEMHARMMTCLKTYGITSLRLYCRACLRSMAVACLNDVESDIWWYGVYDAVQFSMNDMLVNFTPDYRSELERYVALEPAEGRIKVEERLKRADEERAARKERRREQRKKEREGEEEDDDEGDGHGH